MDKSLSENTYHDMFEPVEDGVILERKKFMSRWKRQPQVLIQQRISELRQQINSKEPGMTDSYGAVWELAALESIADR